MDELRWLTSDSLDEMLRFLSNQPFLPVALVDRKLLYWIAGALRDQQSNDKGAILVEEFADGKHSVKQLRNHAVFHLLPGGVARWLHKNVPQAAQQLLLALGVTQSRPHYDYRTRRWIDETPVDGADRPARLIEQLRELFGNPWAAPNPDWRRYAGGLVQRLADEVELDGAWDLMPILGDALEDAGCADTDVLEHCRDSLRHRKGCWVLDLIRMDD